MYVRDVTPMDIGDDKKRARVWDELDVRPTARAPTSARRRTVSWNAAELVQAGVSGFALWWEAELVEDVTISTSPFAPSTHWQQIYLDRKSTRLNSSH